MKKILAKELIAYINEQPEDREVRMHESYSSSLCGCVMVQYANDKLKGYKNREFSCGFETIKSTTKHGKISIKKMEIPICYLIPTKYWDEIKTLGDVQKIVKLKN
jgi:hypothetical protein